jgi:ABC-2 type transport system permease protein/oleandomycin transport system permease protein
LIFASPAFVPLFSMPGWLRAFATHQPVGVVIQATRALMIGGHAAQVNTSTQVVEALAWCVGILVVLMPLAVWRYRRAA